MSVQSKDMIFSKIEFFGKLPDGRIITRVMSYPEGADYAEYHRIDDEGVTAFGSQNCRTIGEPFHGRKRT